MVFRSPLAFPLQGLPLALLVALYLLPGLAGHDLWKPEDAPTIGVVYAMLTDGNWLTPHLAGDPWYAPPFYYWISALTSLSFGWLLPLHDAARLASGLFGALLVLALGNAAEELYGSTHRRAVTLVLIGCLGLFVHIHEAQPALATLMFFGGACWGVALLPRLPGRGGSIAGISIAGAFLSGGLPGLLVTAPLPLLALLPQWRKPRVGSGALLALVLALGLAALWPLALNFADPAYLDKWWLRQVGGFSANLHKPLAWLGNLGNYFSLLSWYAWPALPLALWTLWRERRELGKPGILLPGIALLLALIVLSARFEARSANALPLLVPLALLAAPAAGTLRRGAANGFDWFSMMTFTLAILLVWLGWTAMAFGIPPRIAANLARLEPGFIMSIQPVQVGIALFLSLAWLWQIFSAPRSALRGMSHWAGGMTVLWCISMALWLPVLDYAKSYRPVALDLARHLPGDGDCLSSQGLGPSQRASFHYFAGIVTKREGPPGRPMCKLLLVQDSGHDTKDTPDRGWEKLWEGRRAGDRDESYRLYRRIQP